LKNAGIDFNQLESDGIEIQKFAEILVASGFFLSVYFSFSFFLLLN